MKPLRNILAKNNPNKIKDYHTNNTIMDITTRDDKMKKLSFASKNINEFFNGGLESGVITNVYGEAGAAKTSFALESAKSCINNGKKVIFIDTEGGFSIERFCQMNKKEKLEMILLKEPKTFKEQNEAIISLEKKMKETKDIGLIIIDSLVSLYRLELHNGEASKANQQLSKLIQILLQLSKEYNIPILVTNQVYSDFETGNLELVGGDIPKYSSKCLVLIEKLEWGKRKMTMIKHRSIPEGRKTTFEIKNEGLIDCKKTLGIF